MIQSNRRALQKMFKDIPLGQKFQLVNTVMGAAMPNSIIFIKTLDETGTRLDNHVIVPMRPEDLVELVE